MRKATAVTWADYSVTCTQMLKTHKHFCICLHTEHSYCSEIMQVFPTINIIILPPTTPFDLFTKYFVTSTWPHPAILSFFKGTVFFPFFLCMLHQQSCLIWKGCCFAIPILAFPVFYWKCSRSKWMSAKETLQHSIRQRSSMHVPLLTPSRFVFFYVYCGAQVCSDNLYFYKNPALSVAT